MSVYVIWIAAAAAYALFIAWYHNWRGPLTPAEVDKYDAWLQTRDDNADLDRETMRKFLHSDDGKEFIMVNLIKMNSDPVNHPVTGKPTTAQKVLTEYTRPFVGELMRRAGHPVVVTRGVGGYVDAWNTAEDPKWSAMGAMRYRSRRDLFEMASAEGFNENHAFKIAAMAQTFAFPSQMQMGFALGPRVSVLLVLAIAASLLTVWVSA